MSPIVSGGSGSGGSQTFQSHTITVTSAEILSLFTTPVLVLAAPGSGRFINVVNGIACLNFGTTPYDTSGTGDLLIFYGTDRSVLTEDLPPSNADILAATADGIASMTGTGIYQPGSPFGGTLAQTVKAENQPLNICLATANPPAGGDSSFQLTIYYALVTLP